MSPLGPLSAALLHNSAGHAQVTSFVELEALLGVLWLSARAAWPGLQVSALRYASYLGERLPQRVDPLVALRSAHTSDLYLACACADQNPDALALFDRRFLADSRGLRRLDPSSSFQDEVRQAVRERLFLEQKINEYAGRGKLEGWVQVLTLRVGLDLRRAETRRGEERLEQALAVAGDPELDYLHAHYQQEFREAFSAALAALDDQQRALLRLYYIDGISSERVGALLGVSRPTVSRLLARLREVIFQHTRLALKARLQISTAEFESIVRLIRSSMDVSIIHALNGRS